MILTATAVFQFWEAAFLLPGWVIWYLSLASQSGRGLPLSIWVLTKTCLSQWAEHVCWRYAVIRTTIPVVILIFLVTACDQSFQRTAVDAVSAGATANPALVSTAQADQYWRDAQATAMVQQATLEANYRHVEATAQAGTATAVWVATSQVINLQATEQSVQATGTTQAIELAALASAATAEVRSSATAEVATASAQGTVAAVQSTRQALEIARAESQAQREKVITAVTSALLIIGVTVLVVLLLWLLWRVIPTLVTRTGLVRYGQHRNPLLLLERNGRTVITDPLAMLQAVLRVDESGDPVMPELTPNELQTFIAGGRLRLLIEQAQRAPGHAPQLPAETITRRRVGPIETENTVRHGIVPSPIVNSPTSEELRIGNKELLGIPSSVSWAQLTRWRGSGLALGAGQQSEVIAIDLARTPHLFAVGMTGSGKTRRLLRPLAAQALASGYQVVLMNESGADFGPFYNHPNASLVRGTASDFMAVFDSALAEMERREAHLRTNQTSEWGRLPLAIRTENPPVLLAIDELLALVMLLSPTEQRQFWGLIAAFASRARKVGMCSIGLATDPTYRALGQGGLNYRTQCARVSFRVMQSSGSRAILDETGAESLEQGQFMALLGEPGVVRGMTANPSDEELRSYLAYNQATALPPPAWLETASSASETGHSGETERQIRDLIRQGLSLREIQRQVFSYVGGAAYEAVRQVRDEMEGE